MADRITQVPVEALVVATPNALATQIPVEALVVASPHVLLTHEPIEALVVASPNARASQVVIEVLVPFGTTNQTQAAISRITAVTTRTQASVARISSIPSQSIAAVSRITATVNTAQTGAAFINVLRTKTETAVSRIASFVLQIQTGKGAIRQGTLRQQRGISRVSKLQNKTETGVSRITATTAKTLSGVANIIPTVGSTQTAVARITSATNKTQLGKAAVLNTTTRTHAAIAQISNLNFQTQDGVAHLTGYTNQTQTGKGKITNTPPDHFVIGKAAIAKIVTRTHTGVAHVVASDAKLLLFFTATPTQVTTGGTSILSWATAGGAVIIINATTNGALTCILNYAVVSGVNDNGTLTVNPTDTTQYDIVVTYPDNSTLTLSVTVTVVAAVVPVISSFTATPTSVSQGSSSVLAWVVVSNTTATLFINEGIGDVSALASVTVAPVVTTTYTLTVTSTGGSASASVTVTVVGLPLITSFTVSQPVIFSGGISVLSWAVVGAASLSLDNGIGTVTGSTSQSVSPTVTTTYILTATNAVGTVTASVIVSVVTTTTSLPVITSFTATPTSVTATTTSTLTWLTALAVSLSIDQGVGDVTNLSSVDVGPVVTTTYTLSATNLNGTVFKSVQVLFVSGPAPRPRGGIPQLFGGTGHTVTPIGNFPSHGVALTIQIGPYSYDLSSYLVFPSVSIKETINMPTQMTFTVAVINQSFRIPPQRAYVTLYSTKTRVSLFTGYISVEPTRNFVALAACAISVLQTTALEESQVVFNGNQLMTYDVTCTSDEHLLNNKAISFIPAFFNRSQGDILKTIANILCPPQNGVPFFNTDHVMPGDIVPFYQYDPKQSWSQIAKSFGDGSRYRYKVRNREIWYVPYGDASFGITYDENPLLRSQEFDPFELKTTVLGAPVVNDVTVIGDVEAGNNREDYVLGDGFTGNFPLHHKVFHGASSLMVQEPWTNGNFNYQQWFPSDPGVNFDLSAGALNVVSPQDSQQFPLGDSFIGLNNGLELAGGIDLEHGEFVFDDYSNGIIGGVYTNNLYTADTFLGGFVITTPSGVLTSASGAQGVEIQPTWIVAAATPGAQLPASGDPGSWVGPVITSQPNHTYVLQTIIHAPAYVRYDRTYRTANGTAYGAGEYDITGTVTFNIQDYDIAAATGFFYTPTITTATIHDVPMPTFVSYALINNIALNITDTNTTLAKMPLGGLSALTGPEGLFSPTGLILPMLPATSGGYIGPVLPWPNPASGNIFQAPEQLNTIPTAQVLGNGFQLQAAQITQGNETDTLAFYAQSIPAAGTPVRFQSWEAQAAVSRLQDPNSITLEQFIVGDNGIRSAIVTDLNPLPRTSEDCDNAALAFLQDRTKPTFNGTYQCTSRFFVSTSGNISIPNDEQYWPTVGRFLPVNAPFREIVDQVYLVTSLTTTILDENTELLQYQISFGADLSLEKVLKNFVDLQPQQVLNTQDTASAPDPRFIQNVTNFFLPDLKNVYIGLNQITTDTVTVNVVDPYLGPIEVRLQDTAWGQGPTFAYVGTFQGPTFQLSRTRFDQVWYLRPVQSGLTSRRSKVLRVRWPLRPSPPILVSQLFTSIPDPNGGPATRSSQIQFNFNGDQRSIYGFELRAADNTTILVQKPVAAYADMTIEMSQTPLPYLPTTLSQNYTLFAYFFNAQWDYSIGPPYNLLAPRPPYPWAPGFQVPALGDDIFVADGFGVKQAFTVAADGTAIATLPISGIVEPDTMASDIGPPFITATAGTGGTIPAGTYSVAISAYSALPIGTAFGVTPLSNVVNLTVTDGGSITINAQGEMPFGAGVFVASPDQLAVWHFEQAIPDGQTSITLSMILGADYGPPDPIFNHYGVRFKKEICPGLFTAAVSEVTASTVTFSGANFTANQFVDHDLSLLAHKNQSRFIEIANFRIVANDADTVTVGANRFGVSPFSNLPLAAPAATSAGGQLAGAPFVATTAAINTAPLAQRTVGPEPGLDYGVLAPGQTYGMFGDIQRFPGGGNLFFGNSPTPTLIKMCNTFLAAGRLAPNSSSGITLIPDSIVSQYNIRLTHSGVSNQRAITGFGGHDLGLNITDVNYQNWLINEYFTNTLLPIMPGINGGRPSASNPMYISMDSWAQAQDYSWYGLVIGGRWTNVGMSWDPGYPQTEAQWDAGVRGFFSYMKTHAPFVRLGPHLGGMADWSKFQSTFADVPFLEFEFGSTSPLSQLKTASLGRLAGLYQMLINGAWFANSAPQVFANDPPTRIVQWGIAVDNGDMHSALAEYCMIRGPNTFLDLFDGAGHFALDPNLWVPVLANLGSATSLPTVVTGSGSTSLLQRTFANGVAYFNLRAGPQTITLPSGSVDWNGHSISSIVLQNGTGDLIFGSGFVAQGPIIVSFTAGPPTIQSGASSILTWSIPTWTGSLTLGINNGVGDVTGTTSVTVNPLASTPYTLSATDATGTSTAIVTVDVSGTGITILSFTATPGNIAPIQPSTLSWITDGTETSLSIDNGIGTVFGTTSIDVTPSITTLYILSSDGPEGPSTASVTVFVEGSGSSGLASIIDPGDIMTIRIRPTITATGFSDPNFVNYYVPNGLVRSQLIGNLAWVIAGTGFGQILQIQDNTSTELTLSVPWTVVPNSDSTIIVVEPTWSAPAKTQAYNTINSNSFDGKVAEPTVTNLGGQVYTVQVLTEDVFDDTSLEKYSPIREVFLFGHPGAERDRATFGIGIGAVQAIGTDLTPHFMVRPPGGALIEITGNCAQPGGTLPLIIDILVSRDKGQTWTRILQPGQYLIIDAGSIAEFYNTNFADPPNNQVNVGDYLRIDLLPGSNESSMRIEVVVRWS